jgi:hypothetical protein
MFQSLLTAMLAGEAPDEAEILAARQQAAEIAWKEAERKRAEEARVQAACDRMMRDYKTLEDAPGVAFKTLSDAAVAYKGLDEGPEAQASGARQPFDTPAGTAPGGGWAMSAGTPFFGDTMPIEEIRFLADPASDPAVVDLERAAGLMVDNLKTAEQLRSAAAHQRERAQAAAPAKAQDCARLAARLDGLIAQRDNFGRTVALARSELVTWQAANRNALMNAARDGIEWFTGHLLDRLAHRGAAADRLEGIYRRNADRMAREGVDVQALRARIDRLRTVSAEGRAAGLLTDAGDWESFTAHGVSSLLKELTASNREIRQMLEDPRLGAYFEADAPELEALLDISTIAAANKVFGKWVARKVPIVAGVELAVNQTYNGLDWLLSYRRLAASRRIDGQVTVTARRIQEDVDFAAAALSACP